MRMFTAAFFYSDKILDPIRMTVLRSEVLCFYCILCSKQCWRILFNGIR